MSLHKWRGWLVGLILLIVGLAQAAELEATVQGSFLTMVSAEVYEAVSSDRSINSLYLNAGVGFALWQNLELYWLGTLISNNGHSIDKFKPSLGKMNDDSYGMGTNGLIRFQLISIDTVGVFVDAASGIVYFSQAFPSQGTHWNAYSRVGVGLSHQLSENNHIDVAYRRMHISNGKGLVDDNPAINSRGLSIGFVSDF